MTGLGSSCGACKFLRRKCTSECVFAPYFCYDHAANHFAAVHKVFGASNVSKLLLNLPENCRSHAAITISYEALARMRDPIYGCVAHIFALQQQVASLQGEIEALGNHMANLTVNMAGSGSSNRPPTNPNIEAEISLLQESLYMQHYQNLSPPAPMNQFNHITGNHESNSQMSIQLTPQYRWEDPNNFIDSQSSALEQLLGENKDIFTCSSWLNSGDNIN